MKIMNSSEIRKKFIDFFKHKGHTEIPGTPLVTDDPTLLFVNAGMVQFKPYFLGEKEPRARKIVNCQKCFRTVDIEKVGANGRSLTFFEMLGNWSIGDYWKEQGISLALELLTQVYKIKKEKIWVSVFKGGKEMPPDEETEKIWLKLGIAKEKIIKLGMEDNFWIGGPAGPCGPCSEIYYDLGPTIGCKRKECRPGCDCDRFVEIWNLVFMEYFKDEKGKISLLPQKNIDTGAGLERLALVLQNKSSVFETDLFYPLIKEIEKLTNCLYVSNPKPYRIIADHIKGAVFLACEGVLPSNLERGYVLRRIIRRAIRYAKLLDLKNDFLTPLILRVIEIYKEVYPELLENKENILDVILKEGQRFEKSLTRGLKQFEKIITEVKSKNLEIIEGLKIFDLYQNYGFPLELTEELAQERKLKIDKLGFEKAFKKHQEISRAGAEKKFGGIGKEAEYKAVKLHTATHLLQAALREILGEHVKQMGSDITSQRLRFDFSHFQKLTPEEITKVEHLINQKIKQGLEVKREEMSYEEAIKRGALAFFKQKYPQRVSVYTIGNFSKEICAGPHVKNTRELGEFKIIKETSAGANVRRIIGILK